MRSETVEIREKVIQALCVSLALNPEHIKDDSRLIEDLNMDSLDFLDLLFGLETAFQTKIRDADFDRVLRPDKSEAALEGEFLTPEEIAELAPIMPALHEAAQTRQVARREMFSFITVDTLVKMISSKLAPDIRYA